MTDVSAAREFRLTPEAEASRHSPFLALFQRMSRVGPHLALGAGRPPNDTLPLERWQLCFDAVLARDGAAALQYQPPSFALREWIAEYLRGRGLDCEPRQIFLTNGNQQGLQLVARALLAPPDCALIERPTYSGILDVTQKRSLPLRNARLRPGSGLDLAAWEAACRQEPRPRLAFAIADFHNPTGQSLSGAARARLAALAAETAVPLVEDDAYSALRIAGVSLPPIRAHPGGEATIYLGTFSKMLFPALRLGWIVAPAALIPALAGLRETIDLQSSALLQEVALEFLRRGWLEEHLERLRALLRERLAALQEGLRASFGADAAWDEPEGGLFLWLRLPKGVDTAARLDEALAQGVGYIPGNLFHDDGSGANAIRLNFAGAPAGELGRAAQILARVLRP